MSAENAGWAARVAAYSTRRRFVLVAGALGSIATLAAGLIAVAQPFVGGSNRITIAPPITVVSGEFAAPPPAVYTYQEISDGSGRISVEVPTTWGNQRKNGWHAHGLRPFREEQLIGPGLSAAPNVDAWRDDLRTPGVFIGASRIAIEHYSTATILDEVSFTGCDFGMREAYANAEFTGEVLTLSCPSARVQWRVLAASPTESHDYLLYAQVKLVTERDVEAYNRILDTLRVDLE